MFLMKKHTLLAIAGTVWLLAGVYVAGLGIIDYGTLLPVAMIHMLLSLFVFCVFGMMFCKMAEKHANRILCYEQDRKPIWNFFDLKSYVLIALMMGGGVWLRSSGLASPVFIAVFYTGLGCALAVAGMIFWRVFLEKRAS